jgi:uncharacterized protein YdeI (YjbR/CyaY-like superfamily)
MPKRKAIPAAKAAIEMETIAAKSATEWRRWLAKNHQKSPGIWLRFYQKNSGVETITYLDAVEEALCHGWIDGQAKSSDAKSYLQRFTPRRAKSAWSKINTQRVEQLTKAGRMQAAGLAAVAAAKTDGRWAAAYDPIKTATIPPDFVKELARDAGAQAFFKTLNRTNLYSIAWRLQTARKPETRAKRMKAILKMMSRQEKFHP